MNVQGMLDVKQLKALAEHDDVDTVLCMFTDLQGFSDLSVQISLSGRYRVDHHDRDVALEITDAFGGKRKPASRAIFVGRTSQLDCRP